MVLGCSAPAPAVNIRYVKCSERSFGAAATFGEFYLAPLFCLTSELELRTCCHVDAGFLPYPTIDQCILEFVCEGTPNSLVCWLAATKGWEVRGEGRQMSFHRRAKGAAGIHSSNHFLVSEQ